MIIEAVTLAQIIKPKEIIPQPKPTTTIKVEKKKETKPKKIYYTIKQGDSLTSIARRKKTTVKKLWYKNRKLNHQDDLTIGVKIVIPANNEKLKPRRFVGHVAVQSTTSIQTPVKPPQNGSYANDMTPGYCTFWAKSQRPDLPTGLGNANTWYARASAWGLQVGSEHRVGAVATTKLGA